MRGENVLSEKAYIDAQNRANSLWANIINALRAVIIDGDKDYGKLRDFASKTTQQNLVFWHFKSKRAIMERLYDTKTAKKIIEQNTGYDPKKFGYPSVKDSELNPNQVYARARWHILDGIEQDLESYLKVMELHMTGLSGIDGQVVVDKLVNFGEKDRRNYAIDEDMFRDIAGTSFNELWSNGEKNNGDSTEAQAEEATE